jgi:hypothetical protein
MTPTSSSWQTLPAVTPQWLARRPELLAAVLRFANLFRRHPRRRVFIGLTGLALLWVLSRPRFAAFLDEAAVDSWIVVVVMAAHTAISIVRRKERMRTDRAQSWLAPLPNRLSERARLFALPATELIVLALLLALACTSRSLSVQTAQTLILAALTGIGLGALAGLFTARASARKPEAWRHAIVRQPRAQWATDARLHPLSYWAVAQGRVQFNPGVISRTIAPVLLAIPLGTEGQVAIAIVGGWAVTLYVISLVVATVRTAVAAARWLAPTPIPLSRLLWHVTCRAVGMLAVTCVLLLVAMTAVRGWRP